MESFTELVGSVRGRDYYTIQTNKIWNHVYYTAEIRKKIMLILM